MFKKLTSALLMVIIAISLSVPAFAVDAPTLEAAVSQSATFMLKAVEEPIVYSVGGEWAVLGLARSGYDVPEAWYEGYYRTVEEYVKDCDGVLHEKKYTEYSRVILALTAAGYDPRNVAGYDLIAPLANFDKTIWQGVNGSIFALIALDSGDYSSDIRDEYIAEILRRQLNDGGFNLSADEVNNAEKSDPDVTGMALQALAKYQDKPEVKAAIDKALACLSTMQQEDGGFISWKELNSESTVQVLVALCELGIDINDPRFVKNGNTLLDNLFTYKNDDGSFRHTYAGTGNSQMSTEQAFYGIVATHRAMNGKNSLYRMSDAVKRYEEDIPVVESGQGLPNKHADVKQMPVTAQGKTFADIKNHENQAAIEELASCGIIGGKSNTSFDPDATMTRAEFATIITRGLGLESKAVTVFADVTDNEWYAGFVGTAYTYGIVTGTSSTTFDPNGTITRQEAAVMTARAAKLCGMKTDLDDATIRDMLAQFGDYVTVADWAKQSMAFCYYNDILSQEEFDIQPSVAIKRCEIAEMLFQMLGKAKLL